MCVCVCVHHVYHGVCVCVHTILISVSLSCLHQLSHMSSLCREQRGVRARACLAPSLFPADAKKSPPLAPPLWQVRQQLVTPFLLTVPFSNLGGPAYRGRGGGAQKAHV